jgi:dipeptidyl aminopeptidase/acylaminoacyl peptidase
MTFNLIGAKMLSLLTPFLFLWCTALVFLSTFASPLKAQYDGHGEGSLPKETLEKFAPESIDPKLARSIERALDVRSPGGGVLSPDGNRLYFTWSVTGTSQLWVSDREEPFPVQLTGGNDQVRIATISPDGTWLAITRDEAGKEYPQLLLINTKTMEFTEVFAQEKVLASFSHFSPDSATVYFMANDVGPTSHSAYSYDIDSGVSERLFTKEGYWYIADEDNNKKWLLALAKGSTSREFFEYNLDSETWTSLFGQGEEESYSALYAINGDLVVKTNKFGNFHRLFLWNQQKGFRPLSPDVTFDIEDMSRDHNKTRLLYTINQDGYLKLAGLNLRSGEPLANMPKLPGATAVWPLGGTYDGRYDILVVGYSNSPNAPWIHDWKTGRSFQWVKASTPEVSSQNAVVAELQTYPTRDKVDVPLFVFRPETCRNRACPVIVDFHGGPEAQSLPRYNAMNDLFFAKGFVLVFPNVRGSAGYGKTWLNADNGAKRLDVIGDIEDVALHIRKTWSVNGVAPKIGVMGGSYGGYATMLAMTKFAGAYDAGVAIVGMSDLVSFLKNTAPYRRQLRVTEYGDPEKDLEALRKLSPLTHLSKIKDPLMIIQGANDPRVPAGEAVQMYDAMKEKGIDTKLILFPDEGHGIAKRGNRVTYYGHLLEFFETHLRSNSPKAQP